LDRSPGATSPGGSIANQSSSKPRAQNDNEPPARPGSQMEQSGMSASTSFQSKSKTTSAPTSPLKEKKSSFFGKASNFSAVVSQKVEQAKSAAGNIRVPGLNRDKCFTLLVIDDANTDWSKYFRGKRIHGDYDIRVEQAEFKELSVNCNTEAGVTASIILAKSGNKVVRSFKPDFLLVRQNVRDIDEDHRNILLGFQYGNLPSVNTLDSIYNFQDRPWSFAQLVKVQEKLGKDKFPLVQQTYFPGYQEMAGFSNFPCVFKVGHAHSGMGKVKVENEKSFQDVTSLVALSKSYCTVEPYIDAKYDLHVQKIGENYKALKRKSLSGNWKTNIGQSLLEEVPVSGHHKQWIDEVSMMFGGLDICSLEAVVGKDDKEYIIEVNDCATTLLGESQEDDRKHIAELVLTTMEEKLKVTPIPEETKAPENSEKVNSSVPGASNPKKMMSAARQLSKGSLGLGGENSMASTVLSAMGKKNSTATPNTANEKPQEPPPSAVAATANTSTASASTTSVAGPSKVGPTPPVPPGPSKKESNTEQPSAPTSLSRKRHDSQASETSSVSATSSATSAVRKHPDLPKDKPDNQETEGDDVSLAEEDTMKNLKKTFAGIFGDIN